MSSVRKENSRDCESNKINYGSAWQWVISKGRPFIPSTHR